MGLNVNFSAHGKELAAAHQAVLSDSDATNWLVFSYEKGTNDLKVQDTGDGGLEELFDEFSDGKVQYAYARVIDPNTQLPKYVFVGWCGTGVPESRKGFFNSHMNDVSKFFKSFHVQINARDEADVEPELIMKRVAESSGANYSVHKESNRAVPSVKPVGSVYKKTEIPDIGAMQREAMKRDGLPAAVGTSYQPVQTAPKPLSSRWGGAAGTASAGLSDGAAKVRAEREQAEREAREREAASHRDRETEARQQALQQEQRAKEEEDARRREQERADAAAADARREQEARQRAQREAEDAARRAKQAEVDAARRAKQQEEEEAARLAQQEEDARQRRIQQEADDRARQEREEYERQQRAAEEEEEARVRAEEEAAAAAAATAAAAAAATVAATAAPEAAEPATNGHAGISAVALFDYEPTESNELRLVEGQIVYNIDQVDEGWWYGTSEDGKQQGLFPSNFVEVLEDTAAANLNVGGTQQAQEAEQQQPAATGHTAIALYDYDAGEDNEISFRENDIITQIEFASDDWWQGVAADGKSLGLFPANFVQLTE
ncbi:hypothetical protein BC940DRAFT_289052 [Gongronella butleri]|nr:hypothetical protein BC940DRAFT_289052 [Gongronella butleri]